MTDPTMTAVLENVDRALSDQQPSAEVARFAPQKYRSGLNALSLTAIQNDIRKTINDLDDHIRKLEDHLTQLKSTREELKRSIG